MSSNPALVDEYVDFQKRHRALAEGTIRILRRHVEPFLRHLGDLAQPSRLMEVSPAVVRGYVTARAASYGRSEKRAICFAMRSLLRYASMRGYVNFDLVDAVPTIRTYSLARLPRALPWPEILKLLAAVDRSTVGGKRDYAIILILATYGLRIGEISRIRLDDIDWRHDRLSIPYRKAGRSLLLPLTCEIGEALLLYLREARPAVAHREIFVQLNPPHRPLRSYGGLRKIVQEHMVRAGIQGRCAVPHALRHSLASRLLQQGQPLHAIADILGHASLQTTSIYTKIDIDHLRDVALDIPAVLP